MNRPALLPALLAVAALAAVSCSTATSSAPVNEPVVDQPGEHITRYRSPELEVVVSSRYAATRMGDDWMILQVGVGGTRSASTEVRRDKVSLRTPRGDRIPIMPHREFSSLYSQIAGPARQAAIASEPLDFTRADRRPCDLAFMPLPGTGVVLESQYVNNRRLCQGLLYFQVPGGVLPGTYQLVVELEERAIRVPFELR